MTRAHADTPPPRCVRAILAAIAVALALAAWSPLSSAALAASAHHDCPGDGCPVCQLMGAIAHASTQQADVAHPPSPPRSPAAPTTAPAPATCDAPRADTLVSLKVRLDT